jgi:hypothetical protein
VVKPEQVIALGTTGEATTDWNSRRRIARSGPAGESGKPRRSQFGNAVCRNETTVPGANLLQAHYFWQRAENWIKNGSPFTE